MYWHCLCSCGKKGEIRGSPLTQGKSRCCGCKNRISYGDITGDEYCKWQWGAKKRNKEFTLSIKDFWDIFIQQNKICPWTGMTLSFDKKIPKKKEYIRGNASPDRIDSNKGYIPGNVRFVHKYVNVMRSNKTDAEFEPEFIEFIRAAKNYKNI